jgi:acyl-CoA thioesterase-2
MADPSEEHLVTDTDDPWAVGAVAKGLETLNLNRIDNTTFEGTSLLPPGGRVFGGQLLAQGVMAAGLTAPPDRHIHSLHSYFLRAGDATRPLRFEVEILRDGKSFSARRVHALQGGHPLLSMVASFHLDQDGPEHSVAMPEVPAPETVISGMAVLQPFLGHPMADFWLNDAPFDVRHVQGSLFFTPDSHPRHFQTVWMRVRTPLDVPELTHRALIAFGCDQVMLEPLLRRHGTTWSTDAFAFASLDHAMWWHRPARADEWLLFVQDAPSAQGGRGLTGAWVFSQDGRLVASVAQEGVMRLPRNRA